MGGSLRLRGCIHWKRRAQITEPRHHDYAEASLSNWRSEKQSLIKSASRTMHDEDRHPLPQNGVLNPSAWCFDYLASGCTPRSCSIDVATIRSVSEPDANDQQRDNEQHDASHQRAASRLAPVHSQIYRLIHR